MTQLESKWGFKGWLWVPTDEDQNNIDGIYAIDNDIANGIGWGADGKWQVNGTEDVTMASIG